MKKFFLILCFFSFFSFENNSIAKSCSSDFSCGIGYTCVKDSYKTRGTCMESVNKYGSRVYNMPSTSSVGPNMSSGDCKFNTDCPIGFKCDRRAKVCVK